MMPFKVVELFYTFTQRVLQKFKLFCCHVLTNQMSSKTKKKKKKKKKKKHKGERKISLCLLFSYESFY
jgi:ABC-type polar amino acid transport system ATPase subunit